MPHEFINKLQSSNAIPTNQNSYIQIKDSIGLVCANKDAVRYRLSYFRIVRARHL